MYFILFLEGVRIIFCSVLGETIEAEWPFSARAHFFPVILLVDFDMLHFSSPANRLLISF